RRGAGVRSARRSGAKTMRPATTARPPAPWWTTRGRQDRRSGPSWHCMGDGLSLGQASSPVLASTDTLTLAPAAAGPGWCCADRVRWPAADRGEVAHRVVEVRAGVAQEGRGAAADWRRFGVFFLPGGRLLLQVGDGAAELGGVHAALLFGVGAEVE